LITTSKIFLEARVGEFLHILPCQVLEPYRRTGVEVELEGRFRMAGETEFECCDAVA
jgi:hypothetical protein